MRKRSSQRSKCRTRPLRFESLEERTLLATLYWVADGAPGNWNDADNWSATTGGMGGAGVPDGDDTATFLENANITSVAMGHTVQHMNVGADVIMNADLTVSEKLAVGGPQAGRLGISADKTMTVGYAVIGSEGRMYVAGRANLNVTSAIPGTPIPFVNPGDAIQLENGGALAVRGTVNAGDRDIEVGCNAGDTDQITDHYFGGVLPGFTFTNGDSRVNAGRINKYGLLVGNVVFETTELDHRDGDIRPGQSPGKITIEGDYEQHSSATLEIELGGTLAAEEYDVLDVYGTATLDGTLDVSLINSFTPSLNDSFQILPAGSVVGQFDGIPEGIQSSSSPLPTLSPGLLWDVSYDYGVTLTVVAETPDVTITASDPDANEVGPDAGEFTVSRTGDTSNSLWVYYSVDGTATEGTDYDYLDWSVEIPAGMSSAAITVNPYSDMEIEGDETVDVTLSADPYYNVGASATATVTIADAPAPEVTITASDPNASEVGPDAGEFTVSRTGDTTNSLWVYYSVSGSATEGTDYDYLNWSVEIPVGMSSAAITVNPYSDMEIEGDETVDVTLNSDPYYNVGTSATATVTIADAPAPEVTITASDPNASEVGPDAGEFTVSRTGDTTNSLWVYYGVSGSAIEGTDYDYLDWSVEIPVGMSSAAITVNPYSDMEIEGDETVELTLTADPYYNVGASATATVTIADAPAPEVTITASDPNADEVGPDPGEFTVSRTGDTSNSLWVYYSVDGTATEGTDYDYLDWSVEIPVGMTSTTAPATLLYYAKREFCIRPAVKDQSVNCVGAIPWTGNNCDG